MPPLSALSVALEPRSRSRSVMPALGRPPIHRERSAVRQPGLCPGSGTSSLVSTTVVAPLQPVEPAGVAAEDQVEDPVPGRALGRRADAVAEILVEVRCAPIPVRGDLLLDGVVRHFHNRSDARRAPSTSAANFAHITVGCWRA